MGMLKMQGETSACKTVQKASLVGSGISSAGNAPRIMLMLSGKVKNARSDRLHVQTALQRTAVFNTTRKNGKAISCESTVLKIIG
jgi:hypothetical protein